ncbi:hypothetical protein GUJ93_ZPchr0001g30390 [Zizania palustris]|uniref:Uncharacterized protein n=1 Tax=Zizania palustris TaxID=103762 RepID=A0A8J5RSU0_ZIZPA|nr:hypothetical protein GUJ93_ZPchr0001g30390 [Zizania palustris]
MEYSPAAPLHADSSAPAAPPPIHRSGGPRLLPDHALAFTPVRPDRVPWPASISDLIEFKRWIHQALQHSSMERF